MHLNDVLLAIVQLVPLDLPSLPGVESARWEEAGGPLGPGNTWRLLHVQQGSHLRPPEPSPWDWKPQLPALAPELCKLLEPVSFPLGFYCDCWFDLNCCYTSSTKKGPQRPLSSQDLFYFLL